MKNLKVILIVLGLLFTGFVTGFLTNRHLVHSHIERVQRMGEKRGFGRFLLKKIEASPEQKAALQPILERHEKEFHQLMKGAIQQRRVFADSLIAEISPLLEEEQKEKLNHFRHFLVRGPRGGKPK